MASKISAKSDTTLKTQNVEKLIKKYLPGIVCWGGQFNLRCV